MKIEYNKIRINDIEELNKKNLSINPIFDADNKMLIIESNDIKLIENAFNEITKNIINIANGLANIFINIAKNIVNCTKSILDNYINKRISKKKFKKLLQSSGIQRNQINAIIKNNKEKYTYFRCYNIVIGVSKDKKE